MFTRRTLALLSLLVALSANSKSQAAPRPTGSLPQAAPLPSDSSDSPTGRDSLTGSLHLSPSVAWVGPWGELSGSRSAARSLGNGVGLGLDAQYGLSRTLQIGAWGHLDEYAGADTCSTCSAESIALGPTVSYRLAQGTRFDPWVSVGTGYSFTSARTADAAEANFSGPEWLRLALGGDWYLASMFTLGPFGEFTFGTNDATPVGESRGGLHFRVATGIRFSFATGKRR